MWSYGNLKAQAKNSLGKYYWKGILAALLPLIVNSMGVSYLSYVLKSFLFEYCDYTKYYEFIVVTTTLCPLIFSVLISIFITSPLSVGIIKFFIQAAKGDVSLSYLVFAFSKQYRNIVKTMLLQHIFISLWGLLFFVPGIIKTIQYLFIPFYLAENPELDWHEAFKKSKKATDGQKGRIFVLLLSFIGWYLLAVGIFVFSYWKLESLSLSKFILYVLYLCIVPYILSTQVQLYFALHPSIHPCNINSQQRNDGSELDSDEVSQ